MKKAIKLLLLSTLILGLCACSKKTEVSHSSEFNETIASTIEGTVPIAVIDEQQSPDTDIVSPIPTSPLGPELPIEVFSGLRTPVVIHSYLNKTYPGRYHVSIEKATDSTVAVSLWQQEYYHKDDIENIAEYDNIQVGNEMIIVHETMIDDIPGREEKLIVINDLTTPIIFKPDKNNDYVRYDLELPAMIKVAEMELPLSSNFVFINSRDISENETPITQNADAFMKALNETPDLFDCNMTTADFSDDWKEITAVYCKPYVELVEFSNPNAETVPSTQVELITVEGLSEFRRRLVGPVCPYTPELSFGTYQVTIEEIDGNKVTFKLYQRETYKKEDVAALGIDESIVIQGNVIHIDDMNSILVDDVLLYNIYSQDKHFFLAPWADNGDYYATDNDGASFLSGTYIMQTTIDESVHYYDYDVYSKDMSVTMTGQDFIERYNNNPDSFTLQKTRVDFWGINSIQSIYKD